MPNEELADLIKHLEADRNFWKQKLKAAEAERDDAMKEIEKLRSVLASWEYMFPGTSWSFEETQKMLETYVRRPLLREIERIQAGRDEVVAALEKFARYADILIGPNAVGDQCPVVAEPECPHSMLSVGDLRHAAAVLRKLKP